MVLVVGFPGVGKPGEGLAKPGECLALPYFCVITSLIASASLGQAADAMGAVGR